MAKAGPGAPPGGRWVMGVRAATQGRPYGDYRKGQQIRESGWGRSPAPTGRRRFAGTNGVVPCGSLAAGRDGARPLHDGGGDAVFSAKGRE